MKVKVSITRILDIDTEMYSFQNEDGEDIQKTDDEILEFIADDDLNDIFADAPIDIEIVPETE